MVFVFPGPWFFAWPPNLAPSLCFGPGPQFVFTGPGSEFAFTGPGPRFAFTSPGPRKQLLFLRKLVAGCF